MRLAVLSSALLAAALAAGCGDTARLPVTAGMGPAPQLPPPTKTLLPTVQVAKAVGWPAGVTPTAAPGLRVTAYATGLDHPRWLHVLGNGDVLVAESNAPPKPEGMENKGVRAFFQNLLMKRAGARVPSADRITLLRGVGADGAAQSRTVFATAASGLRSPFGMAQVGGNLYVANADAVVRFAYRDGMTSVEGGAVRVTDLPAGRNHHWTKGLIASADGNRLYAAVGSNSNVAEHGMAEEEGRAAIWEVALPDGNKRLFATGLRNPVGMAWTPGTSTATASPPAAGAAGRMLWVVVNERDELGSDLVPDYLTSVRDGGFYGWPYSYYGRYVDERVPGNPERVAAALVPDYALGPHTASLGLAASDGSALPAPFQDGVFIGQHGSWNRNPKAGYKVIFVPFAGGRPNGPPVDVLTDFLAPGEDEARGRPVGVAIDKTGALLVADDVGNVIWRITAAR